MVQVIKYVGALKVLFLLLTFLAFAPPRFSALHVIFGSNFVWIASQYDTIIGSGHTQGTQCLMKKYLTPVTFLHTWLAFWIIETGCISLCHHLIFVFFPSFFDCFCKFHTVNFHCWTKWSIECCKCSCF